MKQHLTLSTKYKQTQNYLILYSSIIIDPFTSQITNISSYKLYTNHITNYKKLIHKSTSHETTLMLIHKTQTKL